MSRISALKNKINILRVKIIGLQMNPDYKHLESLKNEILELKQEGQCKQITIDSLEFEVDIKEKRVKNSNEITIKLSKEIELLKFKEQFNKKDIDSLVDKLYLKTKDLRDKNEYIYNLNIKIRAAEDKKLKNIIKKLFVG